VSLDEGLSRFIGRLYEAIYDEGAWRAAMAELMQRTGSRIAFVSSVDLRHKEYSRALFYAPEESRIELGTREYYDETYLIDPSLVWAAEHPGAGMCETQAILPKADYLDHPFIKWNKARFGTTHWRVFYTEPVDDFTFALSLHPPAEVGPPPRELRRLHRLLFEHMERALRLAARPPDFSRDRGAVIALDRHGRVVALSKRAEELLASDDGLRCESRHVVASAPESAMALERAVRSAIQAHVGGAGGGVRIKRPSGKTDWFALASPYPRFLEHLPIPAPAAIIRILETELAQALSPEHAELFELTAREVDVASALLEGHSVESLAARLGISRNTVRVHLKALFRKTGTNRQPDLVRILSDAARL
jgi:DNA-binding CsgD family transcriptional regulator